MRWRWKIVAAASLAACMAAAAYSEVVLDIRIPRSSLTTISTTSSGISVRVADYLPISEGMKKKYGADAKTVLKFKPPRAITSVNGTVVEENVVPGEFADVTGKFNVIAPGLREGTFPFNINPRKAPPFGGDRCIATSVSDVGWIGKLMHFRSAAFCVIHSSTDTSRRSMLVGVALADGDPWMRPFARRICHGLTSDALARLPDRDRAGLPDYAACILVDRPARSGTDENLQAHVYEVRGDASVAYMLELVE